MYSQAGEGVTYVYARKVPSMGMLEFSLTDQESNAETSWFSRQGTRLETPYYILELNEIGRASCRERVCLQV